MLNVCSVFELYVVAPRVGAWIEINKEHTYNEENSVAPRVGAWIEIVTLCGL